MSTSTDARDALARNHAASDARVALIVLIGLLLWELGGLDLPLTRLAAAGHAFAWRDHWLTSTVAHNGGRALAWAAASVLLAYAAWPMRAGLRASPSRHERLACVLAVLASLLVVPAIKRLSLTSCPWDLAEFGGVAAYVAHWRVGLADGGPGHCFPSGHAVAAFAFLGLYPLWRPYRPRLAVTWLAVVMSIGLVFGIAQWLRGAHYASHVMWSAWLCWVVASLGDAGMRRRLAHRRVVRQREDRIRTAALAANRPLATVVVEQPEGLA